MTPIFLDTLFVIALINQRDQYHARAAAAAQFYAGRQFLTTLAVILEIGNGLARQFKREGVEVIEHLLSSEDVEVLGLTTALLAEGLALYKSHQDKEWGLVDCISFAAMREAGIEDALTFDQHFVQAGFNALLRDQP